MALKGDLSTIGLAEVFQMISMSQRQGTLVVQDSDSRKCIYFGETGVKLLSTGKRKGLRLGDMLVRAGKLSDIALQDALENAKIQKKLLGEVLVESGTVTEQEIQDVVRSQIEEEIYDLFVWKKATFEFIEGPPSDALRDPEAPVTQLSFDVNGLLLEAVRRADEWQLINQKIPSSDSIFTFVSESDRLDEDKTAPDQLKRVYRLIDGQNSVQDIVDGTGISRFEVCKALLELIDRGRIRILTVHEVMEVAVRRMAEGRRDKALRLYQAAAAQAPKDPKVLLGVARILEGEGMARDAAANYARAGRLFLEQADAGRALENIEKARTLNPEDQEIKHALFEVHAATGNLAAGKKLAQELVAQALMETDYPGARMLCDRILAADPSDLGFRVQRAKILHRTGQKKDLEEELELIRKAMPSDPAAAEKVMRELRDIVRPPSGVKRPSTLVKPPPRKAGRWRTVVALILVMLLAGLGFAGKYELDARRDLDARTEKALAMAEKNQFDEALRLLEEYAAGPFRHSPFQLERARRLLDSLHERKRDWMIQDERVKAERKNQARQDLDRRWREIEKKIAPESVSKALEELEKLRQKAEREGFQEDVQKALESAKLLRNRASDAFELRRRGEKLVEEGRYAEAARCFDRVYHDFSNTDAALGIQIPLAITSRPAGVRVINVAVNPPREVGVTGKEPLVLWMKPTEIVRLQFERAGYAPVVRPVANKTDGVMHAELSEKSELWMVTLGVRIEHEPFIVGDGLYLVSSNRIYAVAARGDKEVLWPVPETVEGGIEAAVGFRDGKVFVGTSAGWVYAIDPARERGNRVMWKFAAGDRVVGGVGLSPAGDAVYAGTAGRVLHAVRAKDGQPLWKRDLPVECGGAPAGVAGAVLVPCQGGLLLAVKGPGPADEAWRYSAAGQIGPLLTVKDAVYFVGSDQNVYAVGAEDGRELWKAAVPAASGARPCRLGEAVYVGTRDGKLVTLDAGSGRLLRRFDAGSAIHGALAVDGNLIYYGGEDGNLSCFDPESSRTLWKFKAKGGIRMAPVIGGGRLYFCSGEVVYAVALD